MKRKFVLLLCLVLSLSYSIAAPMHPKQKLKALAVCWNKGDLSCVMKFYSHQVTTVYTRKSGYILGWQNIAHSYRMRFPNAKSMGKVKFEDLVNRSFTKNIELVLAKFTLVHGKKKVLGYTSLIWQIINGHWYIVSDHSA
jgi:hypothetical protein